jgi:hypothetical protein
MKILIRLNSKYDEIFEGSMKVLFANSFEERFKFWL